MRRLALLLALASCGGKESDEPVPTKVAGSNAPRSSATDGGAHPAGSADKLVGTLSLAGNPLALTACRVGRVQHVFVEVITAEGKLRFEDQQLHWNRDPAPGIRGKALACEKLDRSWWGGNRPDGTSYFIGTLAFRCALPDAVPLVGELSLDCGDITAAERAKIDANRSELRQNQGGSAVQVPPGSAP